jgi:hypothetical protein
MIRDRYDNLVDALPLGYAPQTPPHSRPGGGLVALLLGYAPRTLPHSRPGGDFVTLLRFAAETRAPPAAPEPEHEASPDHPGGIGRQAVGVSDGAFRDVNHLPCPC